MIVRPVVAFKIVPALQTNSSQEKCTTPCGAFFLAELERIGASGPVRRTMTRTDACTDSGCDQQRYMPNQIEPALKNKSEPCVKL